MNKKVLDVVNITKQYGGRMVLKTLSFEVYAGEIFGFIGPNGAGKSTLMRIICGLTQPTSGEVFICDQSVQKQHEKAVLNLGAVVENTELYHYMTGKQNLQYYAGLYPKINNSKIDEVIQIVGLQARIDDRVATYSLGMRQRLALAQALLHEPKLLILDEPNNGLDVNATIKLRNTLKKLAIKYNIGILISSHILNELEQLCDTIAIFDKGSILEMRTLQDFKGNQNGLKSFQITVDYPNYAVKILAMKFKVNATISGDSVILPYNPSALPQYLSAFNERGIKVSNTNIITKNLEDIYLDVLKDRKSGDIL